MNKSSRVIAIRIVLAVVLLSLIFSCVYFFIIKARNDAKTADNRIFATYNSALNSKNINTISDNLGALESGSYYSYALENNILGYKEAYLCWYMSGQLLDANSYRLIVSHGDTRSITENLKAVEKSAETLLRSIEVFNSTRQEYGTSLTAEQKSALNQNFEFVVRDLNNYAIDYQKLASAVFNYTAKSYYEGVSAFASAQYLYSYCLDKQVNVLSTANERGISSVSADIYDESIAVSRKFFSVDADNYAVQTGDEIVACVISYYLEGSNFDDLLSAENKREFIGQVVDGNRLAQMRQLMRILGLQGRLE